MTPTPPLTPRTRSRRRFLKAAAGLGAVAAIGAGGYFASRDRVRLGLIGCGGRGKALADIVRKMGYYQWRHGTVVAVADVNRPRAEAVAAAHCPGAAVYQQPAELLALGDLDAVVVATSNHAHVSVALAALRAGLGVYLEKPFAHTVREGEALAAAVAATGRPFLLGTQQRSTWSCRTACELVRAGRLGAVNRVVIRLSNKGGKGGPFPALPVPAGLDWDAWLGPTPWADYCDERYKGFHYFWATGGGELLNWGPHHTDIALWALGLENTPPTRVSADVPELPAVPGGYETPTDFRVRFEYPGGRVVEVETYGGEKAEASGIRFHGEQSELWVDRVNLTGPAADRLAADPLPPAARLHPAPAPRTLTTVAHLAHFCDVVRGVATPVSDAASGRFTNLPLVLGTIAMRVGRPVRWDAAANTIPDDPQAAALLDPPRRPGHPLSL